MSVQHKICNFTMLFLLLLSISAVFCQNVNIARVKVAEGWLEGEQLDLSTGDGQYFSFKGIPYATPPLGSLRFKAPQPPSPWHRVRKANEHGPKCIQKDEAGGVAFTGSEDCLYLNVYTQNLKPKAPLPVMFFIHGGGYKTGSGNVEDYGPDFLVKYGVVLVTINYRLEVFGFLCLDTEEVPGNAGMKDQVAALKWVKKNIVRFGGDPDSITVFGQSCGGASTAFLMASPLSKNLFKRAIPMSGVPFCDWATTTEPRRRAFALGRQLGIETNDPYRLLKYLQNLPAEQLADVSPSLSGSEILMTRDVNKFYHFAPVVEKDFGQDYFIKNDPEDIFEKGQASDLDVLIGFTNQEGLFQIPLFESLASDYNRYPEMLVPRKIFIKSAQSEIMEISDKIREHYFGSKPITTKVMKDILTYSLESTFVYDISRFLEVLSFGGCSKRFYYLFSSVSERNIYGNIGAKYGFSGTSHKDDLMYLFDAKKANLKIDKKSKSYEMVQIACTLFTNFAKYGNPTPDSSLGVIWPEYNNVTQSYMNIGNSLTPGKALKAEAVSFWRSIYDMAERINHS